jgi:hypothetical protein
MAKLTWLHPSDLHFRAGQKNKWDEDVVLRALPRVWARARAAASHSENRSSISPAERRLDLADL